MGYNVDCFFCQDSAIPTRASIAAGIGINAAKNYRGDNDSVYRLHGTVKGGDRAHRGQRLSPRRGDANIIDQCVAQGVPFARRYGGTPRQPLLRWCQVSRVLRARPASEAAHEKRTQDSLCS